MNKDTIFIHRLQFLAGIGVFEWEKQLQQKLELDLELNTDIRPAAEQDSLDLTLNYVAISQAVIQLAQSQHHNLIETLAEKMAQLLLDQFNTTQVTLTLRKPAAVPAAETTGVRITRHKTAGNRQ
jgi:dihydroneopterin aldolase